MKYVLLGLLLTTLSINSFAGVVLKTIVGCPACAQAENELDNAGIKYSNVTATTGKYVPQLYVNNVFCGYGIDVVSKYITTGVCDKSIL